MMRNRRLDPTDLKKYQDKKLRAIVKHSYDHVQYYRSLFKEAKLKPYDIKTTEDLTKIPASRKEDIRNLPLEKIVATNIDLSNCFRWNTSGSSGVTFTVYWEKKAMLMIYIFNYLLQLNCGVKITDRQVVIGADWVPKYPIQKMWIFKTKQISPFDKLDTQIKKIQEFDPKIMTAYPSCARALAKEIKVKDIQGIKMRSIFTGGETLDPYTRRLVENTFEAEIFDGYGANEVGVVSIECAKHCGYHILEDFVVCEILRDGEQAAVGEEGEITVTNLTNYVMPFIRYTLEDLGSLIEDQCSCGNSFPLMKISQGRKSDVIHLSDGRVISALAVCCRLPFIPGIKQFQIAQEGLDKFTVKITKENTFTDNTFAEIRRMMRALLGDVEIDVVVVDNIQKEKTGKSRQFISKVQV
jgi:phenylacetate-CoA ligase